jgi:predicted methyltransferase
MTNMHRRITAPLALLATLLTPSIASAQAANEPEQTAMAGLVTKAMASDIRSDEERARDGNRKPVETLDFFGITPGMRVLELFPGGGWYTKLLGPALKADGKLYTAFTGTGIKPVLKKFKALSKVEHLDFPANFQPSPMRGIYVVDGYSLPVAELDAVLSFRNVHNLTPESVALLNAEVFRALKPGGIFGVVDHTRRHMSPVTQETFRRADPVEIIVAALAAGFVLEAYSDLHYRPDDGLQFDTQRASVKGNSDRFTLRFRKPE